MNQKEAFNKLAIICSKKENCIADIRKKMLPWGLSIDQQNAIIENLKQEKYIDELRFANAFVKDKFIFNKWGKQKIIYNLNLKKIPKAIQYSAIDTIEESDYVAQIETLLKAKNKQIKAISDWDRTSKLMRFMLQKGYEMDAIQKILNEFKF